MFCKKNAVNSLMDTLQPEVQSQVYFQQTVDSSLDGGDRFDPTECTWGRSVSKKNLGGLLPLWQVGFLRMTLNNDSVDKFRTNRG